MLEKETMSRSHLLLAVAAYVIWMAALAVFAFLRYRH